PEVVAEILGLSPEEISLRASDPKGPALQGMGTIGSRSMMAHGGALAATAREVIKKATDLAAKELEVSSGDLEFGAGRFRVKGTDISLPFREVARRYGPELDTRGGIPAPACRAASSEIPMEARLPRTR
ncbi:MAG TPA: molybdopterin cofactor-binding domain-containing protein, partial [Burkholderiales bacterium]